MKALLLAVIAIAVAQTAAASPPSHELLQSCLAATAYSASVSITELPTNEVLTDDSYRPGYAATYLLPLKGGDIGLAHSDAEDALIESGRLYPLHSARLLEGARRADSFEPQLASWLRVEEGDHAYLCVSFNFPGLGRSGSFQRVRGGYLLPLKPYKGRQQLYYGVSAIGSPQDSGK